MFICSNEFVQFLGQTNAGEVRTRVLRRVDEDNIRVLQISDLHRTAPSAIDPPRFQQEVQRFRAGIQEQLQIWRGRFTDPNQTMSFHGLVVSGDLINGSVIEDDAGATADQKFSCSCVENAAGVLDLTDLDRQVLVVPGNHDIYRRGASIKKMLEPFVGGAHSRFDGSSSVRAPGEGVPSIEELRLFPRLILLGNADGVLAVFGLDSNHTAYELKGLERFGLVNVVQITHLERSVEALRTLFNDRPLYVWVVLHHHLLPVEDFGTVRSQITKTEGPDKTSVINRLLVSVTLDSRDVIAALQRMRVSLVTHGHMHYPALQRVSYLTLGDGRGGGGLNIIACPSFSGNVPVGEHPPYIGAVAVTFAKNRGSTQVDVLATREESKVNSSVTLPALSTSRCSAGEMRVLKRIRAWLSRDKLAHERFVAMSGSNPDRFTSVLEKIWQEYGYTQLSALPDGVVPEQSSEFPIPDDLSVLRQKRYKLLLLLKGEDGAEPRILLNNHCAVRQSSYGTWDAPLLPAFTDVNDFLQRLRMDIYRLAENAVVEKADSSKARQRKLLRLREAQERSTLFVRQTRRRLIREYCGSVSATSSSSRLPTDNQNHISTTLRSSSLWSSIRTLTTVWPPSSTRFLRSKSTTYSGGNRIMVRPRLATSGFPWTAGASAPRL